MSSQAWKILLPGFYWFKENSWAKCWLQLCSWNPAVNTLIQGPNAERRACLFADTSVHYLFFRKSFVLNEWPQGSKPGCTHLHTAAVSWPIDQVSFLLAGGYCGKNTQTLVLKFQVFQSSTHWPWGRSLTSLILGILICKMEIMVTPVVQLK